MTETSDNNLLKILMVINFARYINQELGTNIIVDPDGSILEESSFKDSNGNEIDFETLKSLAIKYGEGMSKFFEVCGDIVVDAATAGIANEMVGTDPNITVIIS